jgi:hypothetical protein
VVHRRCRRNTVAGGWRLSLQEFSRQQSGPVDADGLMNFKFLWFTFRPGMAKAMVRVYSTYDSLNNNKVVTCDSAADRSAYWAPQLKRKSGIVFPTYQKRSYKNDQPVADFPVQPIPAGREMLAGNHMGTAKTFQLSSRLGSRAPGLYLK